MECYSMREKQREGARDIKILYFCVFAILSIFSRPTSFLQKSSCRVSSEKNILNSSVESCGVEKLDKSYILVCLLSIRKYDARMIMYARALYCSFKVRWIGKVYFPTHVFFIINTVIQGAHDNVPTCVIQ